MDASERGQQYMLCIESFFFYNPHQELLVFEIVKRSDLMYNNNTITVY